MIFKKNTYNFKNLEQAIQKHLGIVTDTKEIK